MTPEEKAFYRSLIEKLGDAILQPPSIADRQDASIRAEQAFHRNQKSAAQSIGATMRIDEGGGKFWTGTIVACVPEKSSFRVAIQGKTGVTRHFNVKRVPVR